MSDPGFEPRANDRLVEPLFAGLQGAHQQSPYLVHDGDCPWCRAYVGRLISRGHLPSGQSRTWQELVGPERDAVWAAGIENGMVAYDSATGVSALGEQALLWVLETPGPLRFPFKAMRWRGMGPVVAFGYRCVVWLRRKRFPGMPVKP